MAAGKPTSNSDRLITLGNGCAPIPERLLLAHARGRVLFITGAGISRPAGLPDFPGLVRETYADVDAAIHSVLGAPIPAGAKHPDCSGLTAEQAAEVRRFFSGDYDVVLGMLERRMDTDSSASRMRAAVEKILRSPARKPKAIHRALMLLADRGGAHPILTTNFDLLLEAAAKENGQPVYSYALGAIPRPTYRLDFSGVFHIHGALEVAAGRKSDLVLSDQDFGEFYLRRRIVPDLIYDAARLFHLVLVGYSANDPPMRYLLNAVAADGSRFDDLKERFTFVGASDPPDPVQVEDWKGRGITPISYSQAKDHACLRTTLSAWAKLSAVNGDRAHVDAIVRRLVKARRADATDADRDLFDHLIRRDPNERTRLADLAAKAGADLGWLTAITTVSAEPV